MPAFSGLQTWETVNCTIANEAGSSQLNAGQGRANAAAESSDVVAGLSRFAPAYVRAMGTPRFSGPYPS
jgi:hypothetical protein